MVSAGALRGHLVGSRLAGVVGTSREAGLRSYRAFAARDPRVLLGIDPGSGWGFGDVLAVMAERVGVPADPRCVTGPDVIDPALTLAGLDAFAGRLAEVVRRRGAVLIGTGHPHRLLGFYVRLADALSAGDVLSSPRRRVAVST